MQHLWAIDCEMTNPATCSIEPIRDASRRIVRELGFMKESLAGVDLPPSAVHALLEIEATDGITAGALSDLLRLEKSSVSRLLRKLVDAGTVTEAAHGADGRTKPLSLTASGLTTVAAIHDYAHRQVAGALECLDPAQHRTVAEGLRLYADALSSVARDDAAAAAVIIEKGYRTGALARCTEMHARCYGKVAGFGRSFEALIASGVAEFSGRLDRPRNGFWLATRAGQIVGTVAIDGEDLGPRIAHLRWFIVDDDAQGSGTGTRLLEEAIGFCEHREFDAIHLWTFRGLDAARHLYESHGFVLQEERRGQQWGTAVLEQRFVRPLAQPR